MPREMRKESDWPRKPRYWYLVSLVLQQEKSKKPKRKPVLVIRGGGVGDFILILPLLEEIRRTDPQAPIQILGHESIACLALESGTADTVFSLDSVDLSPLFRADRSGFRNSPLSELLTGAELVISFLGGTEGAFSENLRRLASQVRMIPAPQPNGIHAARQFLNASGLVRPSESDIEFRMSLREETQRNADLEFARRFGGADRVVALHPGSGSRQKNWPVEHFAEVCRRLSAEGLCVLLIEGEADSGLADLIEDRAAVRFPRASNLSLPLLAGVLRRCRAFVGNDSGISHLAGICRIPVLCLFGPTDSAVWRPMGRQVLVLHIGDAIPEQVVRLIRRQVT